MKRIVLAAACALSIGAAANVPSAEAAGCLSGAAIGGTAGHFAGHHALLGAAAGCYIGHHEANRRAAQRAAGENATYGNGGYNTATPYTR